MGGAFQAEGTPQGKAWQEWWATYLGSSEQCPLRVLAYKCWKQFSGSCKLRQLLVPWKALGKHQVVGHSALSTPQWLTLCHPGAPPSGCLVSSRAQSKGWRLTLPFQPGGWERDSTENRNKLYTELLKDVLFLKQTILSRKEIMGSRGWKEIHLSCSWRVWITLSMSP